MVNILRLSIFALFISALTISTHAVENPVLNIMISGKKQSSVSLSDMKQELKQYKITFIDPYYEKEKKYLAFNLTDLLSLAYGKNWAKEQYSDITFRAYDGYESVAEISKLKNEGGYLVFRDLDFDDWEPISFTGAYPGPFYIVWTGKEQTAKNGFPWPWQLESINLVKFTDQFPKIVPKTQDKNDPIYKGYTIFKERCVRCHSINGEGGKVGPDLNAPKNILEYRDPEFVKNYIRDPSVYRFTHMPDNKDLTNKDLENIIDYFNYNLKENKWSFDEKN